MASGLDAVVLTYAWLQRIGPAQAKGQAPARSPAPRPLLVSEAALRSGGSHGRAC
jgi:hypothetical protein